MFLRSLSLRNLYSTPPARIIVTNRRRESTGIWWRKRHTRKVHSDVWNSLIYYLTSCLLRGRMATFWFPDAMARFAMSQNRATLRRPLTHTRIEALPVHNSALQFNGPYFSAPSSLTSISMVAPTTFHPPAPPHAPNYTPHELYLENSTYGNATLWYFNLISYVPRGNAARQSPAWRLGRTTDSQKQHGGHASSRRRSEHCWSAIGGVESTGEILSTLLTNHAVHGCAHSRWIRGDGVVAVAFAETGRCVGGCDGRLRARDLGRMCQ